MGQTEFTGYLIVYGLILAGGLIAVIKPIITLNVNIQKLTDAITNLGLDLNSVKSIVNKHEASITDHEVRITVLENGGSKND